LQLCSHELNDNVDIIKLAANINFLFIPDYFEQIYKNSYVSITDSLQNGCNPEKIAPVMQQINKISVI
jgi:hypothetical protein